LRNPVIAKLAACPVPLFQYLAVEVDGRKLDLPER
jgi:hypothetical protein